MQDQKKDMGSKTPVTATSADVTKKSDDTKK
jgi:hypothetical protein